MPLIRAVAAASGPTLMRLESAWRALGERRAVVARLPSIEVNHHQRLEVRRAIWRGQAGASRDDE